MEKVKGIGGLFFRAKEPKTLAKWYSDNLGVELTPTSYEAEGWRQEEGPTVFEPFPEDTDYFGNREKMWMVKQLQAAGTEVTLKAEQYPNGRFAQLNDPEATRSSCGSRWARRRLS